ncbi:hypothetical protein J5X98_24915 [Leptothermofonsia sichuanensis E412]|uniref:hypothetical protein n=1 Tax=Leptothermofonsia sichuanensis TaxID=2917832 RepID=UPI001CA77014|nr:hypothetical protein [Leptothermofonsia sichuanensis]QZZ20445.1 hypothetical protein J5X98_24915 [Leptothermofonsia sichuanensis E412]
MDQLINDLITIKVYEDDYHLIRQLKKCKDCGQLYFYEFYERIDWQDGKDPQYTTWIPVQNVETADEISQLSPIELLSFTSIRRNFPLDAKKPDDPKWVVKANRGK